MISLELTDTGTLLELMPGTQLQLEICNPLVDGELFRGTFTYSFTLPATATNRLALGLPDLPDLATAPTRSWNARGYDRGVPFATGQLKIRTANSNRYQVQLVAGFSALADALSTRRLPSFSYGGERTFPIWPHDPSFPGYVAGPTGFQLHANDTVANPDDYDYVFAPLWNSGAGSIGNQQLGQMVNLWYVLQHVGGQYVGGGEFTSYQQSTAFPYLRYVLRAVFEELGYTLDDDEFFDSDEVRRLVLVTPHTLAREYDSTQPVSNQPYYDQITRILISEMVPDVTVLELMKAISDPSTFGAFWSFSTTSRTVRLTRLQKLLTAATVDDWTAKTARLPDIELNDPIGLTLQYSPSSEDEAATNLVEDFKNKLIGPEAATLADLPTGTTNYGPPPTYTGRVPLSSVRYVRSLDTWYESTVTYSNSGSVWSYTISWSAYSQNLAAFPVNGGGDDYPQPLAVTKMEPVPITVQISPTMTGDAQALMPHIEMPYWRRGRPDEGRSKTIRILWFRGLQSCVTPNASMLPAIYPMLTPYHLDANGATIGDYSLRFDGDTGTYRNFGAAAFRLRTQPQVVKVSLPGFTLNDLLNLDLSRKKRLDGVDYVIRKLVVTLPLEAKVSAELLRV